MISRNYWSKFYKKSRDFKGSPFAGFILKYLESGKAMIDLGCGNGRDLGFFWERGMRIFGVDAVFKGDLITTQYITEYMKENTCPEYVYTRFFWHSIDKKERDQILKWTTNYLFIEARTTDDKPKNLFGKHNRILVDVAELVRDLKRHGFIIEYLQEGKGLSPYKNEDPHLVRVVAHK